jgi:adenine-specific DNA glycosylase
MHCAAHRAGTQGDVPFKRAKPAPVRLERTLLVIRRNDGVLLAPSARVKGFWDLPEPFRAARLGAVLGEFTHTITHRHYRFTVREAKTTRIPATCRWYAEEEILKIPMSTVARKALRLYNAE